MEWNLNLSPGLWPDTGVLLWEGGRERDPSACDQHERCRQPWRCHNWGRKVFWLVKRKWHRCSNICQFWDCQSLKERKCWRPHSNYPFLRPSFSASSLRTCQYQTTWTMTLMTSFRWEHLKSGSFGYKQPLLSRILSRNVSERFFTQSSSTESSSISTPGCFCSDHSKAFHLVPGGFFGVYSSHLWLIFLGLKSTATANEHEVKSHPSVTFEAQNWIWSSWRGNCLVPMSGQLWLHLCISRIVRESWIFHFLISYVMLSEVG